MARVAEPPPPKEKPTSMFNDLIHPKEGDKIKKFEEDYIPVEDEGLETDLNQ